MEIRRRCECDRVTDRERARAELLGAVVRGTTLMRAHARYVVASERGLHQIEVRQLPAGSCGGALRDRDRIGGLGLTLGAALHHRCIGVVLRRTKIEARQRGARISRTGCRHGSGLHRRKLRHQGGLPRYRSRRPVAA